GVLGLLAQGESRRQDREPLTGHLPLDPPQFVVRRVQAGGQRLPRARPLIEITAPLRVSDLLVPPGVERHPRGLSVGDNSLIAFLSPSRVRVRFRDRGKYRSPVRLRAGGGTVPDAVPPGVLSCSRDPERISGKTQEPRRGNARARTHHGLSIRGDR